MSWDDEDDVPAPKAKAPTKAPAVVKKDERFADEDVDDAVPQDWDAEEPAPKKDSAPVVKHKHLTKAKLKAKEEAEKKEQRKRDEELEKDPQKRADERRKGEKLAEQSDVKLLEDLLFDGPVVPLPGETKKPSAATPTPTAAVGAADAPLKSQADYEAYAEKVSKHVLVESKNNQKVLAFLKKTLKLCCDRLKPEEVLPLKETLTAIYNDRQRAIEMDKKKKKAVASKKAAINIKNTKDFSDHTEHEKAEDYGQEFDDL